MALPDAVGEGYSRRAYQRFGLFLELLPELIREARIAAEDQAHSYRGFNVGASVLAVIPGTDEHGTAAAGNLKRREKQKVCAEKTALGRVRQAGYTRALGLVVSATTNIEQIHAVTGRSSATLHPCGDCLSMFGHHPLVRKTTPIVTIGQDKDIYQLHTVQQLTELYAPDGSGVNEAPVINGFEHLDQALQTYRSLARSEDLIPREQQRYPVELMQRVLDDLAPKN